MEEQIQYAKAELECVCMMHEIAVIICRQSLTGVLQLPLTFLKLCGNISGANPEWSIVLVRVSYQQLFPQFARLVGLWEESWLFSNVFPFRMIEDTALSPTFSSAEFFFKRLPDLRSWYGPVWPPEEVLSDLGAWSNLNLGEQKSQRWFKIKWGKYSLRSSGTQQNPAHWMFSQMWSWQFCMRDISFLTELSTSRFLFLGNNPSLDHTYRSCGTDERWNSFRMQNFKCVWRS